MVAVQNLGEFVGVGEFSPRLAAALTYLGKNLYPALARAAPEAKWRYDCIAVSRLVAGFLKAACDIDASVRTVATFGVVIEGDVLRWRCSMGAAQEAGPNQWPGHMVVIAEDALIDPTLSGFRSSFPFPQMTATPLLSPRPDRIIDDMSVISGVELGCSVLRLKLYWADRPQDTWRDTPDGRLVWENTAIFRELMAGFRP